MFYTTNTQKELIQSIVDDYDNYEKLRNKFILRMILDITKNAALEWDMNDETTMLYNDDPNKMLDFIGCIGLIDFLLKNNLIYIHSQEDTSVKNCVMATNTMLQDEKNKVLRVNENVKYYYVTENKGYPVSNIIILKTNICKLIKSLSNSLVYPMPSLVDYVNNDFKTNEQLNFEKQMKESQKEHAQAMETANNTLKWTRWAFVAALLATIASIGFELYDRFIEKDLSIRELNKTIEEYKIPAVITTKIENDTIKAIIINQHPQY